MKLRKIMPALLLLAAVSGCGYSQAGADGKPRGKYVWHSLYREDIKTVEETTFAKKSYTTGLEFQLSKAVINCLESSTPYKVADRDSADTILEGEIVAVSGNMISADVNTVLPQEEMITISVNFVWKDLHTGRILREKKGFEQTTTYYPTLGEGSYVGKQLGVERLATGIVQELQADW